jgi:serralysin
MATFIESGTLTSGVTLGDSDIYTLTETGSITNTGGNAISTGGTDNNARLFLMGDVYAGNILIYLAGVSGTGASSGSYDIQIGETATLVGSRTGIDISGNGNYLQNAGQIIAGLNAVTFDGNNNSAINSGTISSDTVGVYFGASAYSPSTNYLANTGVIRGTTAVSARYVPLDLVNDGSIIGASNYGVYYTTSDTRGGLNVTNTGLISGPSYAIYLSDSAAATEDSVTNFGTLRGDVGLGKGADVVFNNGLIDGDVLLGDGADLYKGTGSVTGTVDMGSGDDVVRLKAEGVVFEGGDGDDTLYATANVFGATGFETIILRGGDALSAEGDAGANLILGNAGANHLSGDAGADVLRGRGGDDVLEGGADDDSMFGGRGNDTLAGGAGTDTLSGGAGADAFVFDDVAELTLRGARDVIVDFEKGVDTIDLSELVDGHVTWLGKDAFTASGEAEVRIKKRANFVLVSIDADGDGTADGQIQVNDVGSLSAADFDL